MTALVTCYLFGKPAWELDESTTVTARELRDLAQNLNERLRATAIMTEKLSLDGWTSSLGLYDLTFEHPDVHTHEDAEIRLKNIGLDPEWVSIEELEDEEEWEDDLVEDSVE